MSQKESQSIIVLIGGGPLSGKKTLSSQISNLLNEKESNVKDSMALSEDSTICTTIDMSLYYFGNGDSKTNIYVPESIDFELLCNHLKELRIGKTIEAPHYSIIQGERLQGVTHPIKPAKVIIVHGMFALNNTELVNIADITAFVECSETDIVFRRYKYVEQPDEFIFCLESTQRRLGQARDSKILYIDPKKDTANIVLNNNNHNEFQGTTCLVPKILTSLLKFGNTDPVLLEKIKLLILKLSAKNSNPINENYPLLVVIGGGSCSGKTTLSKQIMKFLNDAVPNTCTLISMDSYYLGNGEPNKNYDEPQALDFNLMIDQFNQLRCGNPVEIPVYDFVTHSRKSEYLLVNPTKVIIVEGIFALTNNDLIDIADITAFVECREGEVASRRIFRDINERGRNINSIELQYKDVIQGKKMYIDPTKHKADIILNNNEHNKFQGLACLIPKILISLLGITNNDEATLQTTIDLMSKIEGVKI